MIEQAEPTHIMRIEVSLRLDSDCPHPDFDAVQDAIRICLAVSRAAYANHMCQGPVVSLEDA